ncbi:hypothetical protein GQE99_12275 [Maritimibacter sp. DP07]|uniref:Uncharacterized protein n=1 Tax=Maritimibacter harenae TaxID=2606218 RepID=A0A845M0F1_9RHOB|nr:MULTISPECIES: hypothetical protein [Maritimibacter]MBL6430195.1 hypothetical protein [Maritimibacter sp.]MZR13790.1 hypothetical protein [Maritimibacter harenae]
MSEQVSPLLITAAELEHYTTLYRGHSGELDSGLQSASDHLSEEEMIETARCLHAVATLSDDLGEIVAQGRSPLARFLEEALVPIMGNLVKTCRYDPLDEIWELFGDFRGAGLSPRDQELGFVEVSYSNRQFCLALCIPFDERGESAGPPRLTLETRRGVLWSHEYDAELGHQLIAEAAEDIAIFYERPQTPPSLEPFCCPDHRLWLEWRRLRRLI